MSSQSPEFVDDRLVPPPLEEPEEPTPERPDDRDLGAWSEDSEGPFASDVWEIPGMGESAPGCGEVSAVGFCDTAGHIQYESHLCGRRECPTCWSTQWAGPRTASVVSRLAAARYAATEVADKRAVHAVLSPPEDSIRSLEAFYRYRRRANELAKEHGIRGGVVIAHGYRPTEETKERFDGGDTGIWRWIRSNDTPWKEQVYWSPHYHIVGLADAADSGHIEPGDTEADDGWFFQNFRSLDRYESLRDRDGLEDMIRAVRYLLSHATFPGDENRQAVTWFGELHGTQFDPEEELSAGAWSVIQRLVEELVGAEADAQDGHDLDGEECDRDGCDGRMHSIFHARQFLETMGNEISEEARRRIRTAYKWKVGRANPPPGLKRPTTREQAEEALEAMM